MYTGLPASVHDSTAFRKSNVHAEIGHNHYLLADSAYQNSNFVVTPFRKRPEQPQKEKTFNFEHSKVRVGVEQAIVVLKNRFQSLKQLRLRIDKNAGHR